MNIISWSISTKLPAGNFEPSVSVQVVWELSIAPFRWYLRNHQSSPITRVRTDRDRAERRAAEICLELTSVAASTQEDVTPGPTPDG